MEGEKVFALIYDKIKDDENCNLEQYIDMVDESEKSEFKEVVEFELFSTKVRKTKKFDEIFMKINERKIEIYNTPQVVNYRSDAENSRDEEIINGLFEQEFGEEDT